MDCDACNDLLLDYLYEELDEVRSSALRRHLDGCANCAEAFDRLRLGRRAARSLPVLEAPSPSAALVAAIHAAPAPKLRLVSTPAASVAAEVTDVPHRRIPRWFQRVGEMAMRRQVAMAAVFLLMIGFGLSYHQLQAPTRPLPTSDDPGPMVIPARPVTPPSSPPGAARPADERPRGLRAGSVERAPEPRPQPTRVTPGPVDDSARAVATPATPSTPIWAAQAPTAEGDEAAPSGPPTTYRAQQPAPPTTPGTAVTTRNIGGDNTLNRALPAFPLDSAPTTAAPSLEAQRSAPAQQWGVGRRDDPQQQAAPAAVAQDNRVGQQVAAQDGADAWQRHRQQGNDLQERGDRDAAIEAWRRALDANPPAAERRAIALRLATALQQAGLNAEALAVQEQHLSRPSNTVELQSQVPSPSNTVNRTSRPMAPSRAPSPRSRRVQGSSDSYSNMGF